MKPPTFSAEDSRSRGLMICSGGRQSVGSAGETLTSLPADQGSLASHVITYNSVTNKNILRVRRKISLKSVIWDYSPSDYWPLDHVRRALPSTASLSCLLQSKHFLSIMFKQTQNVSSCVYFVPPPSPPPSSSTEQAMSWWHVRIFVWIANKYHPEKFLSVRSGEVLWCLR